VTSLADAGALFAGTSGYLNTATFGLPPAAAFAAFAAEAERWHVGDAQGPDYDGAVTASRTAFARLVGVAPGDVAVGSQVSPLVGLIAASLPGDAEVVAVAGEFTSLIFPFLAQERRGVRVRLVDQDDLVDAIGPRTTLVAVAAVQSATGRVADLDAIAARAALHGARTLIDGTQAIGWLPLDATRYDYVVCGAYKWLLAPRGTAFLAIRPERRDAIIPHAAGWYAGDDVWSSIYGGPLRLAADARRFDQSPAWLCWVATAPALELLLTVGVEAIHRHDVDLANRFRAGVGQPPGDSAIVAVSSPGAAERLAAAGVRASVRAGAARLSFHLYNTAADAERAAMALAQ
jgi:selenocysteine lyase/cysteine desulfurase